MMLMRRFLFALGMTLFMTSLCYAVERQVALWGHVKDAFTNGGIRNVKVTLMTTDSVALDSQMVSYFDEDKSYMDSY